MSGVVTAAMLKAAARQDKHLQTSLITSQRVFDVAERVDGNIFLEQKRSLDEGGDAFFRSLRSASKPEHDNENIHHSQMLSLKTALKQPHFR